MLSSNPPEKSTLFIDNSKCIGVDVLKKTISMGVLNSPSKQAMEFVIETSDVSIIEFVRGLP